MPRPFSLFFGWLIGVVLLLGALCPSVQATPGAAQVSLQILRSGLPAQKIPYIIRQFDYKSGKARPPRFLKTDMQGKIDVEVILSPPGIFFGIPPRARNLCADYLLIDAKDAPLILVDLEMFRYPPTNKLKQIELTAGGGTPQSQIVRGTSRQTATPVLGADVTMISAGLFPLNDSQRGVSTPQLIGKTGEDGLPKLRPLRCYQSSPNPTSCALVATYKSLGQELACRMTAVSLRTWAIVEPSYRPGEYLMSPPIGVSGQVVEASSGRPIEGAQVELRGRWLVEPMFAFTDRKGKWRIEGIPPQWDKQLFAIATHPKYGLSWQAVAIPNTGEGGWIVDGNPLAETTLRMAGLTTIKGRIIDEVTGKAPQLVHPDWPMRPLLFSTYYFGDAKVRSDNNLPAGYTETEIGPDGSFSLPVPIGKIHLSPAIPFYYNIDMQSPLMDVTEQGLSDVVIRVKKVTRSMIVKFEAQDPKDLQNIQVLDITTNPEGVPRGGDATSPYYMWGSNAANEEVKVRIRYGVGKTFETKFVHSLENWPQIVVLPANPPAPK